jgi:hypothetical protein
MDFFTLGVPWLLVFTISVAFGFVLTKAIRHGNSNVEPSFDVDQAQEIIHDNLAGHQATVLRFKERVDNLRTDQSSAELQRIVDEAARVLLPTKRFNDEICSAYDTIRRQTDMLNQLSTWGTCQSATSTPRDEPPLGEALFAEYVPTSAPLSVCLLALRAPATDACKVKMQQVEQELRLSVQATDHLMRYSETEFAVYMPNTQLAAACDKVARIQSQISAELQLALDAGVTEAQATDELASMMSRVDAALYCAATSDEGSLFQHSGSHIRQVELARAATDTSSTSAECRAETEPQCG